MRTSGRGGKMRGAGYEPLVSARINGIQRDIRIYLELRAVARRFLFRIQPQVLPDEKPAAVSFVRSRSR